MNKRGISLMISYVLLVIVTITISAIVYTVLKLDIPQETTQCNPQTSFVIEKTTCNTNNNITTLEILNDGLFNIDGIFVRLNEKGRDVRIQLNEGEEVFQVQGLSSGPLKPGESFLGRYSTKNIVSSEGEYVIEVQPAKVQNSRILPCENMIIAKTITCGDPPAECLINSDCNDNVDCTNDVCVDGGCQNNPDNSNCPNDGLFCNGAEFCDSELDCRNTGDPCDSGESCEESTNTCEETCTPSQEICGDGIDNDCNGFTDCDDISGCWTNPVCDPWNGWDTEHYVIDPGHDPDSDPNNNGNTIYLDIPRDLYGGNYEYYNDPEEGWFIDWAAGFAIGYDEQNDDLYIVGAGLNDPVYWINYSIATIKLDGTTLEPIDFTLSHQVFSQDNNFVCTTGFYPPNIPIDIFYGRWAGSLDGSMSFKVESTPFGCIDGGWYAYGLSGYSTTPDLFNNKIIQFNIADTPTIFGQIGEWSSSSPGDLDSASVLRKDGSYGSVRNSELGGVLDYKSYPHKNIWEGYASWIDNFKELDGPSAIINGIPMYIEMTRVGAPSNGEDFDRIIVNGNTIKTINYNWGNGDRQYSETAYLQSGMTADNIWAFTTRTPQGVAGQVDPAIYFIALDESNNPFMLPVQGLTNNPSHPGMWVPGIAGNENPNLIILQNDAGGFVITIQGDDAFPGSGEGLPDQQVHFFKWNNPLNYQEGLTQSSRPPLTLDLDEIGTGFAHVSSKDTIYIVTRNQSHRDQYYGLLDFYVIKKN